MGGGYFWYLGPEHTNGVLNPGLINKHLAACLFFLQEWITRAAQLEVPFDIAESEDNVTEKSCDRIMNRLLFNSSRVWFHKIPPRFPPDIVHEHTTPI